MNLVAWARAHGGKHGRWSSKAALAHEKPGQTLQATALVHEAYLRLVDRAVLQRWDSQRHFFAAAAEAMRRILIEQARQRRSLKRGGDQQRVELADIEPAVLPVVCDDLLGLDAALQNLPQTIGLTPASGCGSRCPAVGPPTRHRGFFQNSLGCTATVVGMRTLSWLVSKFDAPRTTQGCSFSTTNSTNRHESDREIVCSIVFIRDDS